MNEDNQPTLPTVASPRGFIRGTGVVRDKDGVVKGTFSFGGEATPEQVKAVFGTDVLPKSEE